MNRAIESALEEIELAYSLQAELEDIRAGRVASVSLDEAVKTLGLEAELLILAINIDHRSRIYR